MENLEKCPICNENYTYKEMNLLICPMCGHEWNENEKEDSLVIRDANGNLLKDGDDLVVIKDLKLKGTSLVIKQGTKVKNIKLTTGDHNINCKIDGIGAIELKSEFLKK